MLRPSNSHTFCIRHTHLRSLTLSHASPRHSYTVVKEIFGKIKTNSNVFSVCTHEVISTVLLVLLLPSVDETLCPFAVS